VLVVGAATVDPPGSGMPQARSAAAVVGSWARRSSSATASARFVLVGVGRPAFLRQVAMAVRREVSTLGVAGVPVTEAEADAEGDGDAVDVVGVTDVDAVPPAEPAEQAASAGTASRAAAAAGTSVRIGVTIPPRLGA
jgi:hypothetical protein